MRKSITQKRNTEEKCDTIKKLNLQTIVIDEGEQFQVNRLDQIFNKNIGETSPNQEKLHICKYKKHREYQLDKKKAPLWSIIVKTLSIYNTLKKIIDSYKRKNTNHIKGQLIRITADLSRNCESQKNLQ